MYCATASVQLAITTVPMGKIPPQKCPSLRNPDSHLILGSLGPPESTFQTASRSVQPSLHELDQQTDQPTTLLLAAIQHTNNNNKAVGLRPRPVITPPVPCHSIKSFAASCGRVDNAQAGGDGSLVDVNRRRATVETTLWPSLCLL